MKLSTKSRYGTRAMIEIARHYGGEPVKRRAITEIQRIPDSYLENILTSLKESGLILTIRGARGGYHLAKPPEDVTVLDVVEALQGPVRPVPCVDDVFICAIRQNCTIQHVWEEMYQAMQNVLAGYTLKELTETDAVQLHQDFMI